MSDTCSGFNSACGEAVGEALRLDGEGGEEDGGEATPDRGER